MKVDSLQPTSSLTQPADASTPCASCEENGRRWRYEARRSNIEHEDELIDHRLQWLLLGQSFLMGGCIAVGKVSPIVMGIGITWCVVASVGISAAVRNINIVKGPYDTKEDALPNGAPAIVGAGPLHSFGLIPAIAMPALMAVAWLLIWWYGLPAPTL